MAPSPPATTGSDSGTEPDFEGDAMSDRSTLERPAAARRSAEMSINNLTFLVGVGAIVATVVGGSCSTNVRIGELHAEIRDVRAEIRDVRAEIRDVRAEIRDVRALVGAETGDLRTRIEAHEDSTAASFATVHRQLAAVAVCMLEIRSLVGGGNPDRGRPSTACDSAIRAILAPSAPNGR